jgi:glycine/D-amino acid oxidase-like deaminating enzyme
MLSWNSVSLNGPRGGLGGDQVGEPVGEFDVVVVGAGTAGIPCAIAAAEGGARVLLVEKDRRIGGTLHISGGHLAAAGARRQRGRGIADSPDRHLEDILRISGGTARADLIRIVVEHAAETVDWLADRDFDFAPETPRIIYGHEPYSVPRTYYGRDEGLSILAVLQRELDAVARSAALSLWTDSPVVGIESNDGAATVTVLRAGADVTVRTPAVVLATGGFAANAELFAELEGAPLVSAAHMTSTGDGLYLARELGARIQGRGSYMPSFGGLPDPRTPGRANWSDRQILTSERAPVEIYVDPAGRRWVAEDEPSIDAKERRLADISSQTFWTVFDDAMLSAAVGRAALVVGCTPDDIRAMANSREGVHSAGSLADLAVAAGIDAAGLCDTVERYNSAVARGVDPDLGRMHLPAPIARPPFYAIRNHGIALVTFAGLDIDDRFRVRDGVGRPIPHLYAVGEVIGAAATCGQSFCSGMLVTPAITFGRLLGRALAASAAVPGHGETSLTSGTVDRLVEQG